MAERLADYIPKEDFSDIKIVHYTAEVIEGIDVIFGIAEGAPALIGVAENIGGEALADGLLTIGTLAEGALTVLAPLAAIVGEFAAIGAGYAEALENISGDYAARGFALGVVLAVDGRQPKDVLQNQNMWSPYVPDNPFIPAAAGIALRSYQMGIIAGMAYGRELTFTQRKNFWLDLIARDQGNFVNWDDQQNPDDHFYESVAVVFRREHLS
jgi:hypothetical protein